MAFEELPDRIASGAPLVVVLGDAMLDRWWHGPSHRLSREAPVPVVEITEHIEAPGGAANAAMNAKAMGARVRMVGTVGADAAGRVVTDRLGRAGIDTSGLLSTHRMGTVTKTRIVADDQVLVRADEASDQSSVDGHDELVRDVATALRRALHGADVLLVSDYGSAMAVAVVVSVLENVTRPPFIIVDAHDLGAWRNVRPDVVVPNAVEAERLLGRALGVGPERRRAVADATLELLEATRATCVIVTLDRDGAVVLRADESNHRTLAHPVSERFASGAGDTFAAALASALAVGAELPVAARLAQAAADVAVRRLGTSVCDLADLRTEVVATPAAVLGFEDLIATVGRERQVGRRLVFTNGCFDVLHRGHTAYLRQARELGDRLIVAVNSDDSVGRLKGPGRPVNGEDDRAAVLAALESVDYVTIFDEDTPTRLLQAIRPEIYVKGGDYSAEMLEETPVVRAYGGEVRTVDYVADHSTSGLLQRFRSMGNES